MNEGENEEMKGGMNEGGRKGGINEWKKGGKKGRKVGINKQRNDGWKEGREKVREGENKEIFTMFWFPFLCRSLLE